MDLYLLQLIFIASVFLAVMICCLIPIIVLNRATSRAADGSHALSEYVTRVLSWFNCLTGGVFLAMCFLGLLPNVHKQMLAVLQQMGLSSDLPLAEVIVLLGFFLVLAVDQGAGHCERSSAESARNSSRKIEMSSMESSGHSTGNGYLDDDVRRTLLAGDDDWDDDDLEEDVEEEIITNSNDARSIATSSAPSNGANVVVRGGSPRREMSGHAQVKLNSAAPASRLSGGNHGGGGGGHSHDQVIDLLADSAPRGVRFFVLLFALSTHALFEGIVLGLQQEQTAAIHLFTAIVVHEAVVAATLGFNIAKTRRSLWTGVRYSLIFGATIPVGIGLGMGIGKTPGVVGHLISGGLQGVAAGIFLHITFMQLLPDEFSRGRDGLTKTLFLFIGFLLLLALNLAMGSGNH